MKILIINGSHRKGNTDIFIEKFRNNISLKSYSLRVLNLRDIEIKLPDGCEVCGDSGICPNIKDQFSDEIEPTIRDYDIYIITTPTWDDGVTPLTKIFWDRIVSWCHKERMYLKDKKLAIVTHGMAGEKSWKNIINWVKNVCSWEKCIFGESFTFKSGSKIGDYKINEIKLQEFINNLTG
jgi:multimeric flavodoxin WrbA